MDTKTRFEKEAKSNLKMANLMPLEKILLLKSS